MLGASRDDMLFGWVGNDTLCGNADNETLYAARLADGAVVPPDVEQAERLRRWLIESWREPHILPREVVPKGPGPARPRRYRQGAGHPGRRRLAGAAGRRCDGLRDRERRWRRRAAAIWNRGRVWMAWLVVSNDNENGPSIRANQAIMDAHWAYELANRDVILCAGSLRTDDKQTKTGSVLLLDLPTRADAEAFFAGDPATKAGLRGETIYRWLNVAILDRTEYS
jgi:uncharacterized protein